MKKIILSLIALTLIGAGCSVKSNGNPTLSQGPVNYKITVVKSEVYKNDLNISINKNPATMEELMLQPNVQFKSTTQPERVTKLDGVIATASKEWNLYINDKKIDFTNLNLIAVKPENKIEWRYEAK